MLRLIQGLPGDQTQLNNRKADPSQEGHPRQAARGEQGRMGLARTRHEQGELVERDEAWTTRGRGNVTSEWEEDRANRRCPSVHTHSCAERRVALWHPVQTAWQGSWGETSTSSRGRLRPAVHQGQRPKRRSRIRRLKRYEKDKLESTGSN